MCKVDIKLNLLCVVGRSRPYSGTPLSDHRRDYEKLFALGGGVVAKKGFTVGLHCFS